MDYHCFSFIKLLHGESGNMTEHLSVISELKKIRDHFQIEKQLFNNINHVQYYLDMKGIESNKAIPYIKSKFDRASWYVEQLDNQIKTLEKQ